MPFEEVGVRAVIKDFRAYMRGLALMNQRTVAFGAASNSIRAQFSRSIAGLAGANRAATKQTSKLSGAMGSLGKQIVGTAGGFIVAQASMMGVQKVMSSTIGAAIKFEAQLAEIRALTGATAEDTQFLEGAIKDLARTLPKSPAELGAGAYFILSSGIEDAADAVGVLEVAAKASTIGLGETERVADALTTVLNAYGMSADRAGHVTDVMIEAVKQGKAEASAFAGVLGRVVPLAAQMGISFEEVSANLATFTLLGVSADEAATGLRQVMASLLKPTEDQEEALAELGLSAEELRKQIRGKGLLAVLDDMMEATGGNEAAVARLFPNIRALTSVLGTAGVQMDSYTDILEATENATGNLEEGFAIVSETTQFKLNVALSDLNVTLMELGSEVLPALVPAMQGMVDVVKDIAVAVGVVLDPIGALGTGFEELTRQATEGKERMALFGAHLTTTKADMRRMAEETDTTAAEFLEFGRAAGFTDDELVELTLGSQMFKKVVAALQLTLHDGSGALSLLEVGALAAARAEDDATGSTRTLASAIKELGASIAAVSGAQQENLAIINDLAGARTQEQVALDLEINALRLEQNAAEMAEIGQASLGGAVGSTTSALDKQIGSLQNLAASMVPQALNNEIIALDRELKVLQLGKVAIEAQVNARKRLAQAQLSMADIANLPAMLELKKLELKREELLARTADKRARLEARKAEILAKVGGKEEDLSKNAKKRLAQIDAWLTKNDTAVAAINDEMEALTRSISIRTLEAEIINLQAKASDKNREAMQRELNKIIDQVGATQDLKTKRELYIDTLVPTELLQDIDALERQKAALDKSAAGTKVAAGAIRTLSDTIGDQITKMGLQRSAIDLVTESWGLQAQAMLNLPTIQDVTRGFRNFQRMILMGLQASLFEAMSKGQVGLVTRIAAQMARIGTIRFAQHGFHGEVTRPTLFLAGEAGQRERVDISPQVHTDGMLAPAIPPQGAPAATSGGDPAALAAAVAFALQGLTVVMDGRIVGSLVNDRIGDRTSLLGRGG